MIFRHVSSHQPKAVMSPSKSEPLTHRKGIFVLELQCVMKCGRFCKLRTNPDQVEIILEEPLKAKAVMEKTNPDGAQELPSFGLEQAPLHQNQKSGAKRKREGLVRSEREVGNINENEEVIIVVDGMPRLYAQIKEVFVSGFNVSVTWLKPNSYDEEPIQRYEKDLHVSVGRFKFGKDEITQGFLTWFIAIKEVAQEETGWFKEQKKAVEARNLGEAELQLSYENRMSQMEDMVKNMLKETYVAHERMVSMLNENLEKAHRENINLRKEHDHEQKKWMMIQLGLGVIGPAAVGMCSIL
ncbi:hypothetical protein AXX17_AT1G34630 [Arabidopsis thaliana]|uniref:DUF3444 domain-containing protein n=1 Tax=Arabidopsis thaliana TaxID=3702 RepID=A0A178WGR8_ARATH|nr:hypothetical protein AXX17_AT1G34630 [Arabidopsis thaliana]